MYPCQLHNRLLGQLYQTYEAAISDLFAGIMEMTLESEGATMPAHADDQPVSEHYDSGGDLGARILAALCAVGKDPDALTPEDLAHVDQFHARGKRATLELAHLAGIGAGMRILDAGGGLGGPARTLATEFGCSVEVLDLTEEYCRAGEMLTARTGLDGRVSFKHGSALAVPYPKASFDVVWMQHSSMNIADKERLFAEVRRVLKPGGRLALHEIMAGPVAPIHLPVPWARAPEINHLLPPQAIRALLAKSGLTELAWIDDTASATQWFQKRLAATGTPPPPLGLHLLLGDDFGEMFRNLARNLKDDRVSVVHGTFEQP